MARHVIVNLLRPFPERILVSFQDGTTCWNKIISLQNYFTFKYFKLKILHFNMELSFKRRSQWACSAFYGTPVSIGSNTTKWFQISFRVPNLLIRGSGPDHAGTSVLRGLRSMSPSSGFADDSELQTTKSHQQSKHDLTVWNIPPPSKAVRNVKTLKTDKIFSQLSATLIVQLKMCWIGPHPVVTAARV